MKKLIVIVLFLVVLISFTNYAYGITVGFVPIQIAINPNTDRAYVSHADGTVRVIDTTSDTVIAVIPVSPRNALTGITVNLATNTIYVANSGTNQVAVINGDTNTVSTTIDLAPAGVFPVDVEINTLTNSLYVSNVLSLIVIVIDITPMSPFENQIIDVIPGFDSPARFAFNPNNNLMYMTNFVTNQVSVLDGAQNFLSGGNPVLSPITIGNSADGIEINTASNKIYTANSGSDTVSVIDGSTNSVIATIPVGVNPVDVGVDSANNRIYVSNKNEGTVSVIDGASNTVVKTIPADTSSVTPRLRGLAVHSGTGDVYVIDSGILPGTVTVIDFAANNPPVAKAGPDQVVNEGVLVTLDGVASSDPDSDGLSFSWIKTFGPSVSLTGSSSTSTSFTAPAVNADTLFTFALTVTDPSPFSSIPDTVNVVVKDETTFTVPGTLAGGVVSGSQSLGSIFGGSTYALQIDTPSGALPSGELEQLVIPTGVSGSGVTFDFTQSSQVASGIVEPDTETALFFDLTFGGVDFSQSSSFESGILPKVQFLVDSGFTSPQSFADGCAVVQIELLNEVSGQWELIGDPLQANTNKIYVSNVGLGITPGTLSVIDGSTNNVIDTITIGFAPKLVGFDQNANRIYVANQGTNTVSVIDGSTNGVIATIPVGLAPVKPVVNPNTGNVYVTNQGAGTVSVIDGLVGSPTVNTVIATIPTGVTSVGVDVDTDLNKIYVTNTFGSSVTVIDGSDNTIIIQALPIPQPSGIVIDSGNNKAYVSNFDDRAVSVIDTNTDSIIAVIPVGPGPAGLSFNPSTSRLYVANQLSGTVSVIDTDINAAVATITTGSGVFDIATNPNTNRAYVSNRGIGTVSVIDGMPGSPTENQVIDTIAGFSNNFGIAINTAVPNPVRDPSSDVTGQCAYIAQPPHFSKFSIGSVKVLAVAGVGIFGGGSNANYPNIKAASLANLGAGLVGPDGTMGFGAVLTQADLSELTSPEIIQPGEKVSFRFDVFENQGINNVGYASLSFIPANSDSSIISQGETTITFTKYQPLEVIDSNGILSDTDFTILKTDKPMDVILKFDTVFTETMQASDIVLEVRDLDQNFDKETFASSIIVQSHTSNSVDTTGSADIASNQLTKDVESSDNSPYQNRIPLFTSQMQGAPIIPIEAADTPAPKAPEIPIWVKNNVRWWSEDEIDDDDFLAGIKYLTEQKIIVVTQTQVSFDSVTQQEIPYYVKRSASWWSEGIIMDDEFLQAMQWWINKGTMEMKDDHFY